ncbi:uncharacterized protein PV09_03931 [Verruconis gallopava]|uniref:Uncharacterized protein n=1 Tax=Verruconis gallopava TaxID=253628 RepID=A0A0D1XRV4_9PEZI|nr:uncharacterized protein PV09_03931 [Verruconis gallopava]KIW05421.1 hypothetical protein PV09_03931 [Verruconis gallopava]
MMDDERPIAIFFVIFGMRDVDRNFLELPTGSRETDGPNGWRIYVYLWLGGVNALDCPQSKQSINPKKRTPGLLTRARNWTEHQDKGRGSGLKLGWRTKEDCGGRSSDHIQCPTTSVFRHRQGKKCSVMCRSASGVSLAMHSGTDGHCGKFKGRRTWT